MKLIDKLKNVFFEEVEDDEEELPQTFAKKVEVPKKKVEIIKKEKEIDTLKEEKTKESVSEEEEIIPKKEEEKEETSQEFPMMFDEEDFLEDKNSFSKDDEKEEVKTVYKRENREFTEDKELYHGKKEVSYVESINNRPSYSYTKSYYEEKEAKGFKPSPIISPIYGILDKNYHKEEVVTKRETRIVSSYNKPDLDSIRNKAFGRDDEVISNKVKDIEKDIHDNENTKVYDVNSNKPQVNKVTLADADEYYNDLGLAYNVDYSDASRTNSTRTSKYSSKDKKKKNNVDDNLFDLIDSMYNKED